MREHVLIYVNGQCRKVSGQQAFLSLSDYLREVQGLVGTKIVCSEGDCGACSVLIGRPRGGRMVYQAVDACIQFVFQLDNTHVLSVEGLRRNGSLSPVQQAMVDCHGSQCGFCTPGFVVTMTGLLECKDRLAESDLRYGLTGNLCRCTGYTPIIEAGIRAGETDTHQRIDQLYPPGEMLADFAACAGDPVEVQALGARGNRMFYSPIDLDSAVEFLDQHPAATIVAGATDLGVRINKGLIKPDVILDLNRVEALDAVDVAGGQLSAGARATWTAIEEVCRQAAPQFAGILELFGSPQIRNVGTIGGNIANASPIADSLPFLYVVGAELELAGPAGTRKLNINDFYQGYKQMDLQAGELLARVRIPLPDDDQTLRLYKVSRRRDLDISSFTAAILMRLDGDTIDSTKIAFGGVGPTILRARQTEDFLANKPFTEQTMQDAGDIAVREITPISDVRGTADFRFQLTRNILRKFFHEQATTATTH